MSLDLAVLQYIVDEMGESDWSRGVSLSMFKKMYNIPASTFYRAVNKLIKYGFIKRLKRDTYTIEIGFALSIKEIFKGVS